MQARVEIHHGNLHPHVVKFHDRARRFGLQAQPADPARPDGRTKGDDPLRAKRPRGADHLVHQVALNLLAQLRRHIVRHEDARRLPDLRIDRRLEIHQVRRNRIEHAALGIPNHVAVHPHPRGRRRQPHARQNLAILMHRDPAAGRGVILVELHALGFRQTPVVAHDERLAPGTQQIHEQVAVLMHVLKGKCRRQHQPSCYRCLFTIDRSGRPSLLRPFISCHFGEPSVASVWRKADHGCLKYKQSLPNLLPCTRKKTSRFYRKSGNQAKLWQIGKVEKPMTNNILWSLSQTHH